MVLVAKVVLFGLPVSMLVIVATIAQLIHKGAGRVWWRAFALLVATGSLAGGSSSLWFMCQPNPELRIACQLVPVTFLKMEEGKWVGFEYGLPLPVALLGLLANVLLFVAVLLVPLFLLSVFMLRWKPETTRENGELEGKA